MRLLKLLLISVFPLMLISCNDDDSSSSSGSTNETISYKGSCYSQSTTENSSRCTDYYSTSPSSVFSNACTGQFSTSACSQQQASFGDCKVYVGSDMEYQLISHYAATTNIDELSEAVGLCSQQDATYATPEWLAQDSWGATAGYADTFSGVDATNPGAMYHIVGDGCEISGNSLLCKSTGGSSGKAAYTTASTLSNQRVTANLSISGGDYNGTGSGAFLVLWSDSMDIGAATSFYACGVSEGTFVILDGSNGSTLATGTNTAVATDGAAFDVTFTAEGTSLTCDIGGSVTESLTHTLTTAPSGSGYAGLIAGWFSTTEKNFAYWDDVTFLRK